LRHKAKVIVMDEPTTALTDEEIKRLFTMMRSLCTEGVGIFYISHRMDEIYEIGDRITIMRDGAFIGCKSLKEISIDELIRMMVGRSIKEQIPKEKAEIGEVVLKVENLERTGEIGPVSFEVHKGEIFGISGFMGSGRTELVRAIFGADPYDKGHVEIGGRRLKGMPRDSIRAGIGFITEDRKGQGLVLKSSVSENLTLANIRDVEDGPFLSDGKEDRIVSDFVSKLRIRIASPSQKVMNLSGGNQQKVVLAKWLAARCRVLIFDEPTRGIDVGAKAEIYHLIGELVGQGVAVIMISSEMPELLGLADRVGVMHEGKMMGIIERKDLSQEAIVKVALSGQK
ncbi:MAG: sugar ABC transporter ATP-binding protein, partial [Oligoflexales bacterium]|nr:sugar ABC transporter ATP-binding protein [Oligoflexales bacterium]